MCRARWNGSQLPCAGPGGVNRAYSVWKARWSESEITRRLMEIPCEGPDEMKRSVEGLDGAKSDVAVRWWGCASFVLFPLCFHSLWGCR